MTNEHGAERAVSVLVMVLAAAQIALALSIAFQTLGYPYPLEWMEGGSVDVIARVRAGLPLYTRPTAEYVPYIYAPLYYFVAAAISWIVGVGFLAGRLVSFLSVCGLCGFLYRFVRREGGAAAHALASVGIFLGTYDPSGRWFYLARVDSLFLLFVIGGFYVLRFWERGRSIACAALLFWMAFLTKQSGLFVGAVALPFLAVAYPKRALPAAAAVVALILVTNAVMNRATHGWWQYFIYALPEKHPLDTGLLIDFWRDGIGRHVPLAAAGAVALFAARVDRRRRLFYAGLIGGLIAASAASRIHTGGWLNDTIPAFLAFALAMPLGVQAAFRSPAARLAGLLLLAVQLGWPLMGLRTALTHVVPTAADRAAGDRYVAFLRSIDGQVIVWNQRFVETRAGKRSWGLEMAATDILRSSDAAAAAALEQDVIAACHRPDVAGVIEPPDWLQAAVRFGPPIRLFDDPHVFVPVTGRPERPSRYYPVLR